MLAIKELKKPENEKELKSFFGAIQYLSKYIENLSEQTVILRKLLKKDTEWKWTEEQTKAFENLKQTITEIPCLAHYNSDYPNIITTDASTKGLGATQWTVIISFLFLEGRQKLIFFWDIVQKDFKMNCPILKFFRSLLYSHSVAIRTQAEGHSTMNLRIVRPTTIF